MTNTGRGLALLMLCALAACGDEDGEGEGATGFDGLEARSDKLVNEVEALSLTDPSSLPTTGETLTVTAGLIASNHIPIPATALDGTEAGWADSSLYSRLVNDTVVVHLVASGEAAPQQQ